MFSIDAVGMYFGGIEVDTFSNPNSAKPNIIPQVELQYILFDTLNWIPVTGTFVATGNEKYLVIGCFKANSAVNYSVTNTNTVYAGWAGYNIDDVSCVELDDVYAGRDTTILPGDSLFIGKTNDDDWIDAKFTWYQLPGATAISSLTGLWVKPVETSTYIVKQEICSYTIWDTIVITIKDDDTRIDALKTEHLKLYPLPATEWLELSVAVPEWYKCYKKWQVVNPAGLIIIDCAVNLTNSRQRLDVSHLPEGIYFLRLAGPEKQNITKRFVILR